MEQNETNETNYPTLRATRTKWNENFCVMTPMLLFSLIGEKCTRLDGISPSLICYFNVKHPLQAPGEEVQDLPSPPAKRSPINPFSGVRSSCEVSATNRLFAASVDSAAALRSLRCAVRPRSCSVWRGRAWRGRGREMAMK